MAIERAHHGKASIEQETVRPSLSRLFAPLVELRAYPDAASRTQYAVEESLEKLAWWAWWAHGPQRTYPLVRPVPHPLEAGRALRLPLTYPHASHHTARAQGRAASVAHARHRREARALRLLLVAAASIGQGSLTLPLPPRRRMRSSRTWLPCVSSTSARAHTACWRAASRTGRWGVLPSRRGSRSCMGGVSEGSEAQSILI